MTPHVLDADGRLEDNRAVRGQGSRVCGMVWPGGGYAAPSIHRRQPAGLVLQINDNNQ